MAEACATWHARVLPCFSTCLHQHRWCQHSSLRCSPPAMNHSRHSMNHSLYTMDWCHDASPLLLVIGLLQHVVAGKVHGGVGGDAHQRGRQPLVQRDQALGADHGARHVNSTCSMGAALLLVTRCVPPRLKHGAAARTKGMHCSSGDT